MTCGVLRLGGAARENEAELICNVIMQSLKGRSSKRELGFSPACPGVPRSYGASCKKCLSRGSSEQWTGVLRHNEHQYGTALIAI